uniref:hypothetical protein n=1 Tax=Hominenteromicrobium sp. TaxID=3073581 RepID=UPI003AEF8522
PDQEFLFQRIQVFRHKDELLSGRILTFMILHGQAFFYPSVSTFIIASVSFATVGVKNDRRNASAKMPQEIKMVFGNENFSRTSVF